MGLALEYVDTRRVVCIIVVFLTRSPFLQKVSVCFTSAFRVPYGPLHDKARQIKHERSPANQARTNPVGIPVLAPYGGAHTGRRGGVSSRAFETPSEGFSTPTHGGNYISMLSM